MNLTRLLTSLLFLALLTLTGCNSDSSKTTSTTSSVVAHSIVEEAQAAGLQDVSTMKYQDLWNWFDDHRDVAVQIRKECEPHYNKNDPTISQPDVGSFWANKTAEQKLCAAAFEPGSQYHKHTSHKTY